MPITCAIPSIHGVADLSASVFEFEGAFCLRLQMVDNSPDCIPGFLGIWFAGPNARERVRAYADAINTTSRLPSVIDETMGASS